MIIYLIKPLPSFNHHSTAAKYPSQTQPLQPRPQQVVGTGGGSRKGWQAASSLASSSAIWACTDSSGVIWKKMRKIRKGVQVNASFLTALEYRHDHNCIVRRILD
jgi:hypothetical protein